MKSLVCLSLLFCMLFPIPVFADQTQKTLCAIAVNGNEVTAGTIVLHESDGTYAIGRADAISWGLVLPTKADQAYQGTTFVLLRNIPKLNVVFDEALQRLDLTVPPNLFDKTFIDEAQQSLGVPTRSRGAFLTYDVRSQSFSRQVGTSSMIFDAGGTLGAGTLNATFFGALGNAGDQSADGIHRISSSWQQDNVAAHTTLRIGDSAYNSDFLVPGNPFAGVQFESNFATEPDMDIHPRPSVSGSAASPSNADIYVDGKLVLQEALPTGPFQIQNIPLAGTTGSVQVIVKDAQGHSQTLVTPYYTAPNLLAKGLTEFAWGAGVQSLQTNTGSPQYDGATLQGARRYGFSDRFTGEVDGQLSKGWNSLSSGGVWGIPKVGLFDAAVSLGQQGGTRFDYDHIAGAVNFGFGMSSIPQQSPVIALGPDVQAPITTSRSSTAFLAFPILSRGALSLSLLNENDGPGSATRTLTAGYTTSLGGSQLSIDLLKSSGSFAADALTLSLTVPLGPNRYVAATVDAEGAGSGTTAALTYESDPVLDGPHTEPGYSATVGNDDLEGSVDYPLQNTELTAAFSQIAGIGSYQLEGEGSLGVMHGRLFASRSITQAYGLAIVPGWAHVHVYSNGEFVGTTNARGEVFLPNLIPYRKNLITLDDKDFPVTANVESLSKSVVPYYNSPVTVIFPVKGIGGVLMHMVRPDGSYLPAGAMLTVNGVLWPIADLGEAYVGGTTPGPLTVSASWDASHCTASIVLPKDMSSIPNIGKVICR